MAVNGTTRRHQELRLHVGNGADGKPAFIVVGYLLETDWGRGAKSYDVELITANFQPVLYQQNGRACGGTATVLCDKADFAKRYKVAVEVRPPTEPGEAAGEETPPGNPDQGHE